MPHANNTVADALMLMPPLRRQPEYRHITRRNATPAVTLLIFRELMMLMRGDASARRCRDAV